MTGIDGLGTAALAWGESVVTSGVNLSAVRVLLRRLGLPVATLGLEGGCPVVEEAGPGGEEVGVGDTDVRLPQVLKQGIGNNCSMVITFSTQLAGKLPIAPIV